ncbi:pentapeptide repeat-containing protein [Microbacterium sp. DT81.1]|uniref:pentapeptide repeat-containing protein n=1 Tax=Microbacterium sp. DT81.1 TaxID=3393413 RepID=UPI003CF51ECD
MARTTTPLAPRIAAPDLPRDLGEGVLRRGAHVDAALLEGLSGRVDAPHAHLVESIVRGADVERLDLGGSSLTDVEIEDLRGVDVSFRETRWQTVRMTGGRIGTLDLSRSDLNGVELRGMRVDYLTLAGATASDLLLVDCTLGSLDAPQAKLSRVRFEGCRVDEVDNRDWRIEHVDLRGLEAVRYLDMAALRGATLSERQVTALGPDFAAAAGVLIRD